MSASTTESETEAKKNIEKALYWYKLAAAKNHKEAQYNIGLIYLNDNLNYENKCNWIRLYGQTNCCFLINFGF